MNDSALRQACYDLAPLARSGLVITHGNGPQLGLLMRQIADGERASLDEMNARTEGWLGYHIEQELGSALSRFRLGDTTGKVVTLLTRVEVNPDDPAFAEPDKPIGRRLSKAEAKRLADKPGYTLLPEGDGYRCLVASPEPVRCLQAAAVSELLQQNFSVVCAGGGGIPVARGGDGEFSGVDAVIDKDRASALLAEQLNARLLILATDVDGVYPQWPPEGKSGQRPIARIGAGELASMNLEAGSMGPKAEAAARFAERTGNPAVIGSIDDLALLGNLRAGTRVTAHGPAAQEQDEQEQDEAA